MNKPQVDDLKLVRQAASDLDAFGELYERHVQTHRDACFGDQ